jgi:RNA polymerase sigma-54 factor
MPDAAAAHAAAGRADDDVFPVAMRVCKQPIDLLAKRDVKRLALLCGDSELA